MLGITTSPEPSGRRSLDDAAIGRRRGFGGVLDQSREAVADGLGLPAVEAEEEFVEVALQVLGPGRVT